MLPPSCAMSSKDEGRLSIWSERNLSFSELREKNAAKQLKTGGLCGLTQRHVNSTVMCFSPHSSSRQ